MELFREDGCMTDAGFRAMMDGQLDELGRLEAAEHLSYCDQCMDRYTALLTADALETPPRSVQGAVMGMHKALSTLRDDKQVLESSGLVTPFAERQRLVGKPEWDALEKRYT